MMSFFDIQNIAFDIAGYPVSIIEFSGTFFGLISVYLASRTNILTWPTGIINEFLFFILFFQVQLYADMILQLYFFGVTVYGWYFWKKDGSKNEITSLGSKGKLILITILIPATLMSGFVISRLHILLPVFFSSPAAFPYSDSFVMISSIAATILLARKKTDSWLLWIVVDTSCIVIYYFKGTFFLSIEYLVFLLLAIYGFMNWKLTVSNG